MGIKGLNDMLRKNCINVFEEIHISEYAFKKVAIDTSLFLCKFKAIAGDKWLEMFIKLVSCLRRNEIHCVFIYDAGFPPEKAEERAERRRQAEKNKQRVIMLETALENYFNTGIVDTALTELNDKLTDKKTPAKRLLSSIKKEDELDIDIIKKKIDKMRSNILEISLGDFILTKKLFNILNIPYFDACLEAETSCSDLCKRGIVDAVLSEDTDVLAYSTPVFLTKIDIYRDTCIRIHHKEILDSLELTGDQFLDLCIMCGCDYNKNIPKVGPETSYKYLKKYGLIEDIEKNLNKDVSILNHIRTRELFKEYKQMEIDHVPFCGVPNFDELKNFIFENNININIEYLKKCFTTNNIIVEEEDYINFETIIETDDTVVKLETHIEIHSNIEINVKPDFNREIDIKSDEPDSNTENNTTPVEPDSNMENDDDLIEVEIEVE